MQVQVANTSVSFIGVSGSSAIASITSGWPKPIFLFPPFIYTTKSLFTTLNFTSLAAVKEFFPKIVTYALTTYSELVAAVKGGMEYVMFVLSYTELTV